MIDSTFNRLKRDHLELLCDLARLEELFRSVPLRTQGEDASAQGEAAAVQKAPIAVLAGVDPWPQRKQIQEICVEFCNRLQMHFAYETSVVFPGIVMAMPTKAVTQWVFARIYEHGRILAGVEGIEVMLETLELPANKRLLAVIERNFQNLRGVVMQHALEEDTKIDALLRNNPEIGKKIQQLKANRVHGKSAPASASAPL